MSKEVRRGEIWMVDWSPGRGSEQSGIRPALVIQTDAANRNVRYPNTVVLCLSTKGKAVPFHMPLPPSSENGLAETSFVKCEQVLTVSKERLVRRVGHVTDDELEAVAHALRMVLQMK